jgi:hypothetical protein
MRRRWSVAVAASLLLAGCGSDRLSADQLRARATRVCVIAGQRTNRIATPSAPAGGARFLKAGIAILTPELAQLRALKPPSDLADVYATSISSFSRKLELLRSAAGQLDSGANPVSAMTELQQHLAPVELAEDGAWRALQVPACLNR